MFFSVEQKLKANITFALCFGMTSFKLRWRLTLSTEVLGQLTSLTHEVQLRPIGSIYYDLESLGVFLRINDYFMQR